VKTFVLFTVSSRSTWHQSTLFGVWYAHQ